MQKIGAASLGLLTIALALSGCLGSAEPADLAVASYPAAFLAETLVGEDLVVADLTPSGAVHNFEPSARDLDQIRKSTYLVLWDEGLESWAHSAEESLGRSAPTVLQISNLPEGEAHIPLQGGDKHSEEDEGEEHADEHTHDHGHDHGDLDHDPHTWNDPLAMQASARVLAAALQEAYPQHAEAITQRLQGLEQRLTALDQMFQEGLATCQRDTIVTNHEAHNYMARRYHFEIFALHGLAPGSEPSPATVQEAIETIQELGLPTIFIEEGADPDALRSIQDETHVEIRVLHTNEARPEHGDYLDAQLQNREELRTALGCS